MKLHRWYLQENNGICTRDPNMKCYFCQNQLYCSDEFTVVQFSSTNSVQGQPHKKVCPLSLHQYLFQSIAGDFTKERLAAEQDGNILGTSSHSVSTSLDESSLDGVPTGRSGGRAAGRNKQQENCSGVGPPNLTDAITRFMETTTGRQCLNRS